MVVWRPPSRPRRPPFALGVQGVAKEAAAVALRAGKPARERSISRPAHPASAREGNRAREGFARWDLKEIGRGFLGKKRDKKGRRDREKKSTAPARFRYPARSRIPPTRRARLVDFHSGRGDWTDSSVLCSSWCPACAFACLYVSSLPPLPPTNDSILSLLSVSLPSQSEFTTSPFYHYLKVTARSLKTNKN